MNDAWLAHGRAEDPIRIKSGVPIPTFFFEQEESRSISAVVYSIAEAFNCRGSFGGDLIRIHNLMATSLLPRGYLYVGRQLDIRMQV